MVTTVSASHATTVETVTLQLQWKHQFEFAGFYAAIHKGIYAKYGIHLELKEYQPGIDNLEEVLSGRAQYGLYHSGIIQARLEGKPLILLANYFKRFPLVILAKPPLRTLADLKGKRLMVSRKDLDSPLYKLAFAHEKLNPNENITIVPHSFDTEPFIRNEIDAMSALLSNEPFYLEQRGIAFNIIDLSDYMRSMGDMYLFTSETQAKHRPHLTQDLITATNEGWQYALEHKAEIVELILSQYSQRKSREALLYEAEKTHELIMPLPLPIRAVFEDVIQDIAKFFKQQHLIAYPGNLTNFIFNYSLQPISKQTKFYLTQQEHTYLNNIVIKRALAIGRQPFNFKDNTGNIVGIAEDYWQLIRSKLELRETTSEKIAIEDVPTAIQNNMAEVHPNIMHKEEYASYAVFSDVYDEYPIAIATRKNEGFISNAAVLEGRTVAVGINYNAYYLLKEKYPTIKFLLVPNTAAALQQVAEGKAFAAVDVLPVLQYQITQLGHDKIALTGVSDIKYPLQIMLHQKHDRLLPLINRAIADITPEEHLEINKKWLLRDVIININYEHLWQLIIVAALIISTILYWNRRLRLEITHRKKSEAQLRKLSRAVEQSHNMVVITDLDANIEFVNPAFTNVTGYTFQEAIGQNPRILNSGYHTKDFYLNMWEKLDHGQVWQGEILNKRKNGELYWENVIISPIKDEAGVTTHFVAIKEDINLRKLAEQALKKSQTQYQRLVEDIGPNFVIYSYRSDSIIEYVNKGANTVFGVNAAELIGRSWPSAISWISDSLYRALEVNKKFVTGELTEAELEMEFIHPNGNLRTINVTIHPVCDANDKYIYSEGIVENITERKHIQRQIEEQRRTLHTILENIPAGVQVIAANGKIILNNQHAEQILKTKIIDKTPIKELNRMYSAFIYGTDILYPHENMPIVRGLLGETSMVEDMELRHPDGSRMLLQVIGAPIPDINGNINSSVVIFFDITARKEMERIRQLNESRLDALLELSHKSLNMIEEELCRAGQEAAEKLTSSKISYLHLINPEQETTAQYQLETERFISASIIEDENVKMVIGVGNKASPYDEYDLRQLQRIAEDLWHIIIRRRIETELKAARHAAEAASHAKSTFIAHISHELRTPLTGILGFAQLLLIDKSLSNIHHEYVHTMQKSGEHLLGLINEILDLAKIGAGKLELNPVPVHLPSLLQEVIAITKVRADNKGLYLNLDMETLPMAVLVDSLRLNQIILNLLGNAIKFTQHGEVKLWIRSRPILELTDTVQITFAVLDTGPGIPADRIHHVLLPFERLANQTNEGAGLGLSISNALISKMGGQLILGSQTASGLWAATINEIPPLLITTNHGTIAWFSLALPLTTTAKTIGPELIYADSESTAENNPRLTAIDIPNLSVLHQAIQLTEAGNVVGLQKFCDSTQKNYPLFTTQVLNYLEQFQLNELKIFLNNLKAPS